MLCGLRTVKRRPLIAGLALAGLALPAVAVDTLTGRIESVTAEDWQVSRLQFAIDFSEAAPSGEIRVGKLELPTAELAFENVLVSCGRIGFTAAEFACLDAAFTIELPGLGRETFPGEAVYDRRTGDTRFSMRDVPVAGGRVRVSGNAGQETLDVEFTGNDLAIAGLAEIAGALSLMPPDYSAAAGTAEVSGAFRTRNGAPAGLSLDARLTGTSISNEPGTVVTEAMHGRLELTAEQDGAGWRFEGSIAADAGEAYFEPVYASLAETPISVTVRGTASSDFGAIEFSELSLRQGSLIEAAAEVAVRLPASDEEDLLLSGLIELGESSFESLYSSLLQVFVAGTMFGDLEAAGTVSGVVTLEANRVTGAVLTMRDLIADDRQQRFAVYGLNGVIHWPGPEGRTGATEASHLRWDNASAYSIPLGTSSIEARLGADDLELLQPLRIPTLGGALVINRLSMKNYGTEDASGLLDAVLEPVELGRLTAAFGWPAFSGELSGQLPLLQYEGGVMTVGGTLSAEAFDGDIEFSNLRLEQPFGLAPRLSGDLRLRELDLEQVTDTFSFGLIQGRLSGDVTGLDMIAWRPVAMDLHLYTPVDGSSRRRISQRAVENLASVGGGGAAAALSSGFMKFFEEFAYEKIGIRCILEDGVCRMSGAGRAGDSEIGAGYYIVKGSGLPRIDVVGYRHQVSWTQLLNQLTSITQSGSPIVN